MTDKQHRDMRRENERLRALNVTDIMERAEAFFVVSSIADFEAGGITAKNLFDLMAQFAVSERDLERDRLAQ